MNENSRHEFAISTKQHNLNKHVYLNTLKNENTQNMASLRDYLQASLI